MKKSIICLAIVCSFASVSMGAQLLTNLDCEQASGGWADRENGSAVITYQTAGGNSGNCIAISGGFSERVESDPIATFGAGFTAGSDTVTGSAYLNNANGASRCAVYINCYNGTTFTNRSGEANHTAASWAQINNSVVPAAAATGASLLIYGVSNGAPGKLFDDVSLDDGTVPVSDWYLY